MLAAAPPRVLLRCAAAADDSAVAPCASESHQPLHSNSLLKAAAYCLCKKNTQTRTNCSVKQAADCMPVFQKRRHGLGGKEAAKEAAGKKPSASGGSDASSGMKNGGEE